MKRPVTRKEQAAQRRKLRMEQRSRQQAAMTGAGSQKDLPIRDQGPVRAMVRDYVDRRRTVAEFMLPGLLAILMLSFIKHPIAQTVVFVVWIGLIFAILFDTIMLIVMLRSELRKRFEPEQTRGAATYAVLRSTQMRRFRLPVPMIEIGDKLRDRY